MHPYCSPRFSFIACYPLSFSSFLRCSDIYRSEVRTSDGRKLWWTAGDKSIFSPWQLPHPLYNKNSGCTLIITALIKLFALCFLSLLFLFFFLWCTHCSLSALNAAAFASVKVCLQAVNNHLFNIDRTIRRWFYANFSRDRSTSITSTFIHLQLLY